MPLQRKSSFFIRTIEDWYSSYSVDANNSSLLEVSYHLHVDIPDYNEEGYADCRIVISGTDDHMMYRDFSDREHADAVLLSLTKKSFWSKRELEANGFSWY